MQTETHWKQLVVLAITRPYILANPRWDPTRHKSARPKCVPTLIEPRLMVPPPYLSTTKVVSSCVGFVDWHVAVEDTTRIQLQDKYKHAPLWTHNGPTTLATGHALHMRTKPLFSEEMKYKRAVSCQ
jgi:hypothetical protein